MKVFSISNIDSIGRFTRHVVNLSHSGNDTERKDIVQFTQNGAQSIVMGTGVGQFMSASGSFRFHCTKNKSLKSVVVVTDLEYPSSVAQLVMEIMMTTSNETIIDWASLENETSINKVFKIQDKIEFLEGVRSDALATLLCAPHQKNNPTGVESERCAVI